MSLSHALAEINNLQTKVIRLQGQVADQETRIKKKEAAAAPQSLEAKSNLHLDRLNAQLDNQLASLSQMTKSVKGLDQETRTTRKQSELAMIMSIVSFMLTCYYTFLMLYSNRVSQR